MWYIGEREEVKAKMIIDTLVFAGVIKKPRKPKDGYDEYYQGRYYEHGNSHMLTPFVHKKCGHLVFTGHSLLLAGWSCYCWHCHKEVDIDEEAVNVMHEKEFKEWLEARETVLWFEWK